MVVLMKPLFRSQFVINNSKLLHQINHILAQKRQVQEGKRMQLLSSRMCKMKMLVMSMSFRLGILTANILVLYYSSMVMSAFILQFVHQISIFQTQKNTQILKMKVTIEEMFI